MRRAVTTLTALLLCSCASERGAEQLRDEDDASVVITDEVDASVREQHDARVEDEEVDEPEPQHDAGVDASVPRAGASGGAAGAMTTAGASGGAAGAAGASGAAGATAGAGGAPAPTKFCKLTTGARLGCDAETRKLYPQLMLSWVFDGHIRVCGDGSAVTLYPCAAGAQCQAYNYDTKKSTSGSCQ